MSEYIYIYICIDYLCRLHVIPRSTSMLAGLHNYKDDDIPGRSSTGAAAGSDVDNLRMQACREVLQNGSSIG